MVSFLLLGLACVFSLHFSTVLAIPCPPGKSFPHPLNCEDFYLCDPVGNHKHFTCPLGLHFNAAKEACDWPLNANCSTNATQTIGSKIAQAVNKSTTEEREKTHEESSFEGSLFDKVKGILGLGGSTEPSAKAIKFEIGEILPEKEDSNKSKEIILNHSNLTKVGIKKEDELNIKKVDTLMSKNESENGSVVSHPSHEGVQSVSSTNQPPTKPNQEAHSKDLLKEKRDIMDSTTPKHVEEEKKKKLTKGDGKIQHSEQPTKEDLKPKKSNNKNKDSVKNEEKGLKESKSENKDEELVTNPFHFSKTYKEIEENPIFHIYSLNDTERVFGKISGYKEWEELVDETTGKDIDDDNVTNISITTGDSKDKSTDEQPSEW